MALKYKEGDRVQIKSLDWYNENKNNRNEIIFENNPHWRFVANQSDYCGQIATITSVSKTAYRLKSIPWNWTDEMIEGLVEEESLTPPLKHPEDSALAILFHKTLILPEGYQFKDENGNIINATKIVLEKKRKEYPKTYGECCAILNEQADVTYGYKKDVLHSFQKLLVCRDAYWKIAGDEMGLGKPWEPDWTTDDVKHSLVNVGNTIIPSVECKVGRILAFPTKKIRDNFKDNFDPDIEICKELL